MSRTIMLATLFEAMEKGGYEQGYKRLMCDSRENLGLQVEGYVINDADCIGQAALNLGIDMEDLASVLKDAPAKRSKIMVPLFDFLVKLNDDKRKSLKEIAADSKKRYSKFLTSTITVVERDYTGFTNYRGVIL